MRINHSVQVNALHRSQNGVYNASLSWITKYIPCLCYNIQNVV